MEKSNNPETPATADGATTIETHEELVARLPEILRRLNEAPEIGRLTLVNPVMALEDIGFTLSAELQQHLRKTLPVPRGRIRQIGAARRRLRELLREHGEPGKPIPLPQTPGERARLLFDTLGLGCGADVPDALTVEQLRNYRGRHPIADALYQVGRLERGALVFQNRGGYQAHKAGLPHHAWLKRLRFKGGE